jgi:hypothetical protein
MFEVDGFTDKLPLHRMGIMPVKWPRNRDGSPLNPLLRDVPHAAFQVSDLDRAITGQKILAGLCEPINGYRISFVEHSGVPIELAKTSFSDDKLQAMDGQIRLNPQVIR